MKDLGYADAVTMQYIERMERAEGELHSIPRQIVIGKLSPVTEHEPKPRPQRGTAASRARIHPDD